ncbi:spermidine synthase with an [Candidatus Magnetoovum chiemensis]|nr:spermidine synthase with an [Candidatus Magnetoovum chiemensis]
MAFASFGIITPVLSLVISVFMLGLAIGSVFGGRLIEFLKDKFKLSSVFFYGVCELIIGIGVLTVPVLFNSSQALLLSAGQMNSIAYLFLSAVFLVISILPWCVFMGFTFPFMMSFVREIDKTQTSSFSFLYLANVIGAMSGTLISALVLIEVMGFRKTVLLAACFNVFIALISFILAYRRKYPDKTNGEALPNVKLPAVCPVRANAAIVLLILFTTGFTSMSLEVIWIRAFTPVFGTYVYPFALLLTTELLAIWIGSFIYRKMLSVNKTFDLAKIITALCFVCFLPIIVNDPRALSALKINDPRIGVWNIAQQAVVFISIFPFCAILGYLTPSLIDRYAEGSPDTAGRAYSFNIAGCTLGPIFASYLFLPFLGVKMSMIAMALPYTAYFMYKTPSLNIKKVWKYSFSALLSALIIISVLFNESYEEVYRTLDKNSLVLRDHTATVIAYGSGMNKRLLVNGIGITELTTITKNMTHIPMGFLDKRPSAALVICFGMGASYRSLLSWGVSTTAVELVPSVVDVFGFYFADAKEVLSNSNGKVIIDDGRRFLKRTNDKYDVITIDPPPPVEASGSSLLYSVEFYDLVKSHLKPDGILQQWFPGGEEKILHAAARSLTDAFAYVKAFKSIEDWGIHFLASNRPINIPSKEVFAQRMPKAAKKDMLEWFEHDDIDAIVSEILKKEIPLKNLLSQNKSLIITDDKPYNEYYMLRRINDIINDKYIYYR